MSKAFERATVRLRSFEVRSPDAARLARYASIAVRIDAPLLRALRVELLPSTDAGSEADVWFSPLCESSSSQGFVLEPNVTELLRLKLANETVDGKQLALDDAWKITERMHDTWSPSLRLEERVTWLALKKESNAEEIEQLLWQAAKALAADEVRGLEVARWAMRALPRLPSRARESEAALLLALGASERLGGRKVFSRSEDRTGALLAGASWFLSPATLRQRVAIGVRLYPDCLEFVAPQEGVETVELPRTTPLYVELSWGQGAERETRTVAAVEGRIVMLPRNPIDLRLRTLAGEEYASDALLFTSQDPQIQRQHEFLQQLKDSVERFDRDGASRLCDELVAQLHRGTVLEDGMGRKVLALLRRKAYFGQMEKVAEALRLTSQDDAQIRRQYALALIDQGKLIAALSELESLVERTEQSDPTENAEARGLLGRVYEQLYINAALSDPNAAEISLNRLNLQRAVDFYLGVYRAAPARYLWHGVKAAALAVRAVRDKVSLREAVDSPALAREILATIEAREDPDAWDLATGAEACLVVGERDKALQWIARYVVKAEADAFELASTLRQLKEMWGLTIDTMPGALLLPLLQSQLLLRTGGQIDFAAGEAMLTIKKTEERADNAATLERILGKEGVVSLAWYRRGLDRIQSVGKILTKQGDGLGTGFLVRGGDLVPALGDTFVVLTNAHVLSDDPAVQATYSSLAPEDAKVVFEANEAAGQQEYTAKKLLWTSPPDQLDATLFEIDPPLSNNKPYAVAKRLPMADGVQKVYVIGHPQGGGLSISLNDNLLLDYDDRVLHYRAPVGAGSSGSPIFNQQWDLIGIHHAGSNAMRRLKGQEGTYAANEGIWIQRIIKELAGSGLQPS